MADNQFEVGENRGSNGFFQSLNLLSIHEQSRQITKPGEGSTTAFTSTSVRPTGDAVADVLDFSVPIMQDESCLVVDSEPDSFKPANRYEAAVSAQVENLDSESEFTAFTRNALGRDADRFPPVRNEREGTTTYTIEQFGLTDRDLEAGENTAEHYKRLVSITVPDAADSLDDCKFEYQDRQEIREEEFNDLISRSRVRQVGLSFTGPGQSRLPNSDDISFYTHGIRTAAVSSDFQALALQLTSGHSVVNVDWKSTPPSEEKLGLCDAYNAERNGAAESYHRFEPALDAAINLIGAENTNMIAFSHGAMFDTRYLQHRKASGAHQLNQVIFSHPDVPISTMPQPGPDGKVAVADQLYANVARDTFVIGSPVDLAMTGAAYNDCPPSQSEGWVEQLREKQREMAKHARIGNGGKVSRDLVEGSGGKYIMETIPTDKKDATNHFINMSVINGLVNRNGLERISVTATASN